MPEGLRWAAYCCPVLPCPGRFFSCDSWSEEVERAVCRLGPHLQGLHMAGLRVRWAAPFPPAQLYCTRTLPDNLFARLPALRWLDLRDNLLLSLPASLSHHPSLEVVLLDNNLFTEVPASLSTLPRLSSLSLTGNILRQGGGREGPRLGSGPPWLPRPAPSTRYRPG